MTQTEYVKLLIRQLDILEKIADNTERQIRFLLGKHRSLGGLTRLLQARAQLIKQLEALTEQCGAGQQWKNCEGAQGVAEKIRHQRIKIREFQRQALETARAEKTRIGDHLSAGRVTRNIRTAYIGRWYQGLSQGFSRTV